MGRTARTRKLGDKSAETGSVTGQVVQVSWRGQLGQENGGRTGVAVKIQQDNEKRQDRTAGTGQPRKNNFGRISMKGTVRTRHLKQDSQNRSVRRGRADR
jgi:hypothetical protein